MGPGYVGAMIQKYESGPAAPEEPAVKPAVAEAKAVIKTSVRGEPIDTEEVDDEKISKLGNMFISTVIIESDGEEREVKELVMSSEDLSSSPDSSVLSDDEPTEYAFDDENAYEIPKSDSVWMTHVWSCILQQVLKWFF